MRGENNCQVPNSSPKSRGKGLGWTGADTVTIQATHHPFHDLP